MAARKAPAQGPRPTPPPTPPGGARRTAGRPGTQQRERAEEQNRKRLQELPEKIAKADARNAELRRLLAGGALSGPRRRAAELELRNNESDIKTWSNQLQTSSESEQPPMPRGTGSPGAGTAFERGVGPSLPGQPETIPRTTVQRRTPTTPPAPTPTAPRGGGGGGKGGASDRTREKKKPQVSWEEQLRKFFPGQAWMLDLDRVQYPKLFELLERAYKDGMWKTPEGLARFQAELANTDFGVQLRDKGINTAIKTTVGDLGFGTENYNKFIVNAANFGWQGDQLVREVYREAFRKNNDGTYANETARERALKSNDYLGVANIGTQFFTSLGEDTVQKVLTGDMARDDVERQQRELAKSKYGHLANLIDQGFTMQELANPYRQIASNLLEKTPGDVDMSQSDYEAAYNFTDDKGNKRLMTEGEWERLIKSDAKYGWQNTNNANRTARSLAQSIAQSFGRLT